MHVRHLLAVSSLLFLGNAGLSLARLDESDVPSECTDICGPVVQASQKCDRSVPDRETRMECRCTWIQLKTSGTVSDCRRCMHQGYGRNWNKRDDYDSDDSDDSDDDSDYDHDMYQSCRARATDTPTTSTTMTMQPSATATGSESGKATGSSSSSTASGSSSTSSSTEENGAVSLSMSASLAAVAGLVTFAWL